MQAYIQHGSYTNPPMTTEEVEVKENQTWRQIKGLSFTATGYGKKIPTTYMVKYLNRWYRVYCAVFSNVGRLYIVSKSLKLTVSIEN